MLSSFFSSISKVNEELSNKSVENNSEVKAESTDVAKAVRIDNNGTAILKKIVISNECQACGSCSLSTQLIKESANGKAEPVEPAIVDDKNLASVQSVINSCPAKAIFLANIGFTNSTGKAGLNELKQIIIDRIKNYKYSYPNRKEYEFNKSEYSAPTAYGNGEYRYDYKSSDKAEQAGLKEFDRVMYSQSKAIIMQILVDYKNKKLRKYSYYDTEVGNYYYDFNRQMEQLLKQIVAEAKALSNGKINFPKDIDTFEVTPQFGISGDAMNRELYVYQLRHIEELWFVQNIMNERESLSWYQTYIDTDDTEDSRGKYMYCYKNISDACSKFGGYLLNDTQYVMTGSDGVQPLVEAALKKFYEDAKKVVDGKVDALIKAIDSFK